MDKESESERERERDQIESLNISEKTIDELDATILTDFVHGQRSTKQKSWTFVMMFLSPDQKWFLCLKLSFKVNKFLYL